MLLFSNFDKPKWYASITDKTILVFSKNPSIFPRWNKIKEIKIVKLIIILNPLL